MGSDGWPFTTADEFPEAEKDPLHPEFKHVKELYFRANPEYKGRFVASHESQFHYQLMRSLTGHADTPFRCYGTKRTRQSLTMRAQKLFGF